jgi:hypothetical protein
MPDFFLRYKGVGGKIKPYAYYSNHKYNAMAYRKYTILKIPEIGKMKTADLFRIYSILCIQYYTVY